MRRKAVNEHSTYDMENFSAFQQIRFGTPQLCIGTPSTELPCDINKHNDLVMYRKLRGKAKNKITIKRWAVRDELSCDHVCVFAELWESTKAAQRKERK